MLYLYSILRILPITLLALLTGASAEAQGPEGGISLDSLLNIQVSTASKYEQTSLEAPASLTIISHEDILHFGYNDIGELLNMVRDMYLTFDRNYTYLGVRGFSRPTDYNKRIAVMVNGVLVNENIWGSGPLGTEAYGINLDNVERVEIVRGPGSALYGNYPMLGIINIIMQSGKEVDGINVSAEGGSFGKMQGSITTGKQFSSGFNLSFAGRIGQIAGQNLYYEEYDDSSSDGIAEKLDWMKFAGYNLQAAWKGFTFDAFYSVKNGGNPTGAYGTLFNDDQFKTSDQFAYGSIKYERELKYNMHFFSRASVNGYKFRGWYPYAPADGGLYLDAANNFWTGAEARFRWDIFTNNRIMAGGEFQQHFKSKYETGYLSADPYIKTFTFRTFAFYLQDEWQPAKFLSITAGGRFDYLYLGKTAITPRLSANIFPAKGTMFKLLYGEAFRAPNPYEANLQDTTYVQGNPAIRKEGIRSMEILWEQRISGSLFGTVSVFRNAMRDLIEQVYDTVTYYLQYQNVQKAGGNGVSAEISGRLKEGNGIHFFLSYSFTGMQDSGDDSRLTNSPSHLVKGGITIPFLTHFRFSPDFFAESARLNSYRTSVNGFVVCNANLIFAPRFKGNAAALNRFQLSAKVRNLLDADYRHPAGFPHLQPSIRQNGRNFNFKIAVNLF